MFTLETHVSLHANTSTSQGLGSLLHGILEDGLLAPPELSNLVARVLRRAEVNWSILLSMITISLRDTRGMDVQLNNILTEILAEAVSNQNKDAFLAGTIYLHICYDLLVFDF